MKPLSRRLVADGLLVADLGAIIGSVALAFSIYIWGLLDARELAGQYLSGAAAGAVAYLIMAMLLRLYHHERLTDVGYQLKQAFAILNTSRTGLFFLTFEFLPSPLLP